METRAASKDVLNLIAFKGYLYPSNVDDYQYLKRRACTSYRLPLSLLPALKKTRLTKAQINIVPFVELWKPFVEHLETELAEFGDVHLKSAHTLLVVLPTSKYEAVAAYLRKVDKFTRRYCIRLDIGRKDRASDAMTMLKLDFVYNDKINNSYAFTGLGGSEHTSEDFVELSLAQSVKLRIDRGYVNGTPTLQVRVLDKAGIAWGEAVNRTGIAEKLSKEELGKLAMFFLEMS